MIFSVEVAPQAMSDIQLGVDYYNSISTETGKRFYDKVNLKIEILRTNPYFQKRYSDIRCLPMTPFPFMIHFSLDELTKTVYIHGIINTYKDPQASYIKK